ncbi:MAG: cupin domain-containing protein [Thermoplasmata archaeon]
MPFPEAIRRLPYVNLSGADVFVHDSGATQVLFMEVPTDRAAVIVPTHVHGVEWGVVVEGEIEITLGEHVEPHPAGSTHLIPAGLPHSFRFRPGTSSIHYFEERRIAPERLRPIG